MNDMNNSQSQANDFVMTAPSQINNKREDVRLLEQGPNVGILYSMIDLGTHYNTHFKKRNRIVRFTFEFPFFKQLFRTDDTVEKPTVVSIEMTFQMAPKSNLKKFCDGALGRNLQEAEYKKGFGIGQFLGKVMMVNIVNKPSKKDPTIIYNTIESVQGITPKVKEMYRVDWHLIQRTNDLQGFMIGDGSIFATDKYSSLPRFLREKLKESDEAIVYANNQGVFAEPEQKSDATVSTTQQVLQPVQRAPLQQTPLQAAPTVGTTSPTRTFVWLSKDFTYDQLKAGGWTDDLLVENGYAKWEVSVPAVPVPPVPAPIPPVPNVPQVPVQQQAPVQDLRIGDDGKLEDFSGDVDGLAF